MVRKSIVVIVTAIFLVAGTAQAQYADKPRQQAPAKDTLCSGCTVTGKVHSFSKDWIKIEQKENRYYNIWTVFFYRITSKTEIIGTIRKGKTVTITYTKECIGGRYSRSLALIIKAE